MKIRTMIPAIALGTLIIISIAATDRFEPAEDLPSGAVVYAETSDLPSLLDIWERSTVARKYVESRNFRELSNRRLGIRLAERWREFSDGIGADADLGFIRTLSEKRAALAVYDVGKLDLVIVAPVSEPFFRASMLFASKGRFEEAATPGGTTYYSASFRTDRGRSEQKLLFGLIGGRLVVSTEEDLFKRTEANIKGLPGRASLAREIAFRELASGQPSFILRVWIDQEALNRDFYFRKYWLGGNLDHLKDLRAGVFAVELKGSEMIEHRKYLLTKPASERRVSASVLTSLAGFIPEGAAYVSLSSSGTREASSSILDSTFLVRDERTAPAPRLRIFDSYDLLDDDDYYGGYYRMDDRFEVDIEKVDGQSGLPARSKKSAPAATLRSILGNAEVTGLLTVGDPASLALPLFAEMRRGGVINSRRAIDDRAFEAAIVEMANEQAGVSGLDLKLVWKTFSGSRRLELPMLGREFCYSRQGRSLLFANSGELLAAMLAGGADSNVFSGARGVSSVTSVNLREGRQAFEGIFGRLRGPNDEWDLFNGEISGLFDVFGYLHTVRIETRPDGRFVEQKLVFGGE